MKLIPYPDACTRRRKVVKHVFNQAERWWEVFSGLQVWNRDWNELRATGVVHAEDPLQATCDTVEAHPVCDRNHDLWLAASESACTEALRAARVIEQAEGRHAYIGDQGLYVVVAGNHLVTSYRIGPPGSRVPDRARVSAAQKRARRRAVRISQRQASCMSRGSATRGQGDPDA